MKDHGMMKKDRGATMPVTSQSFVTQAATTDMAEIELAQLALKNSQDAEVKKFADQMVKDHTASSTKLKGIANKENLTLPTSLDPEHTAVKAKLAALKGKDFDEAYGKEMAKGHDKAVALFESASKTTEVAPDLKQFAASTLPTLREHKGMAHDLHGNEGA
jgi:putative membrane protein